jgi:hypothetical protein
LIGNGASSKQDSRAKKGIASYSKNRPLAQGKIDIKRFVDANVSDPSKEPIEGIPY